MRRKEVLTVFALERMGRRACRSEMNLQDFTAPGPDRMRQKNVPR